MFLQFILNGLVAGSIYALVGLGFAFVYNTTKIFHIAYAVLYVFAPYMILSFYTGLGLPFLLSFVISIVLTILLSILIEILVYKPLTKKRSSLNVILISSLGVMIVIINAISLFYGNQTQILDSNISGTVSFGNIILTYTQISEFLVSSVLIILFLLILKFSKLGIKTRAMRDDDELCSVFGINVFKMRLLLFALSGFCAAVAGGLIAYDVGMDPYVGMPMLLSAVVALIIGGMGRFEAPILGGFIIGILQALAVWAFSARWQDVVTFTLLLLFLIFRPEGILGEKRRLV